MKSEIISFKVETSLAQRIQSLPNKSEFIRQALLSALSNTCPLCQGSGSLSPSQKTHWESFLSTHAVEQCDDCQALHIHCSFEASGQAAQP